MPDLPKFPVVSKTEVFVRMAEGLQAGVTMVTPNRRLAQELTREFDATRSAAGLRAWEAADILPFGNFVDRLWEAAIYSDRANNTAQLLSPPQEQALWEEVIAASAWHEQLMSPARAAAQCRDAWRIAHAWRIDGALELFPGNDDAHAFAEWARAYVRRTPADMDGARLIDAVGSLLTNDALPKPQMLIAYGFDIMPPQTRDFLRACAAQGVDVGSCFAARKTAAAKRVSYDSARDELEAAAQWARARLEAARARAGESGAYPRIGVVVPAIEQRRKEVHRIFSRVMQPDWAMPRAAALVPPFNLSLGLPLADAPLAHAALGLLALATGEIDFALASRLLRSPFIGGAEREVTQRAQLDLNLRRHMPVRVTLVKLTAAITDAPQLRASLEALTALTRAQAAGARSPQEWGRHFSAVLDAAGFPGERVLDSVEFQTRAKFYELLGEFARLERVLPRMTAAQALSRLRRLCIDTLFQPESPDAPIQVLGILESAGLEFDHLWVSGMTDDAWPLAARPNPFIPVALQKKAGIPEAAADTALELDRRITEGWLTAADEVVVSHALREQDRELSLSPLIAMLPESNVELPAGQSYRDVLQASRALEAVPDGFAPAYTATTVRGGTRVLADQAACPFRAYAHHRLQANALETPSDGLDARSRGNLLHALMADLWGALKSKARLDTIAPDELAQAIENAAKVAIEKVRAETPGALDGRFADLERVRLAKIAREWLEVERTRTAFEVVAREEQRTLKVASLELKGRIDRMDRLENGGHVLIDYKSGSVTPKDWLDERPNDPQLPLYAINAAEEISAVAFARIKTGKMRYSGLARDADILPKTKAALSWSGLFESWQKRIQALGQEFTGGEARVDPKQPGKTCEYCDLQPLCRVHERFSALEDDGDGEGEE